MQVFNFVECNDDIELARFWISVAVIVQVSLRKAEGASAQERTPRATQH